MGAMRNFRLKIGLVSAAVSMQKATEDERAFSFKRMHKHVDPKGNIDLHLTNQLIVCGTCTDQHGRKLELPKDQITSGYELSKGQFIEITDAEKDSVQVESSDAVLVEYFTSLDKLLSNPINLRGAAYFLVPSNKERTAANDYALILESMQGQVGIGRVSMYNREHTVAIIPTPEGLMMYMLRYPEEIRKWARLELPDADKGHVALMKQIIQGMTQNDLKLDYEDQYTKGLQILIENKSKGIVTQPLPAQPQVQKSSNLEDMLKATLDAIKAKHLGGQPEAEPVKAKAGQKKGKKSKVA